MYFGVGGGVGGSRCAFIYAQRIKGTHCVQYNHPNLKRCSYDSTCKDTLKSSLTRHQSNLPCIKGDVDCGGVLVLQSLHLVTMPNCDPYPKVDTYTRRLLPTMNMGLIV